MNWLRRHFGHASTLDPTVKVFRDAALDSQRSRLPQMAAALSYRTVFGLLPIVAIGLWILQKFIVEPGDLEMWVTKALNALGVSNIMIDEGAAARAVQEASPMFVGPRAPGLAEAATPEAAAATVSLQQSITAFVGRINRISFGAIGLVGVAMLIYAAISMVVEVERAFNQIFRVPRGRSWSRRITIYWTLLTLGPLCLFATFFVGQRLTHWVEQFTRGQFEIGTGAMTLLLLGYLLQILISTALLVVIYQVVPNTKVRFWSAVCGALIAAAVFEASKYGFGKYVEFSASKSYARLYGSLALIPLFLLWVYFTWLIVLFGLQLTYRLQYGRTGQGQRPQPLSEVGPVIVEPAAVLSIMTTLADAFQNGQTLDAPAIAQRARLPEGVVRLALDRLTLNGLLHRLDHADSAEDAAEPTYSLARPPSAISAAEVLRLGFDLAASARAGTDEPAPDPVFGRLHDAQIAAAGESTVADFVRSASINPRLRTDSSGLSPAILRERINPRAPDQDPSIRSTSIPLEPAPRSKDRADSSPQSPRD